MGRRLASLVLGLCAAILLGGVHAAAKDGPKYQPDSIPHIQFDKASADLQYGSDQTKRREYFLAIYSGSTMGTYFYVASALCRAIEADFALHRIHCVPLRSSGVNSNVALMNMGRAQFIIVQSDTNYNAAKGIIDLPDGRSVMSLHNELGLLAVRPDAGISTVADLRGKRVNLGPVGTASRGLWEELLKIEGIEISELAQTYGVQQNFNDVGLCSDYIDAFGLWIGHPTPSIWRSIKDCGAKIVGMTSPRIDAYVASQPHYFKKTIPANTYTGQDDDIQSYGFKASLVANRHADPYVVYWAIKSVQKNLDLLRSQHPALASIIAADMFSDANALPFHEGAVRYWREAGVLKDGGPSPKK